MTTPRNEVDFDLDYIALTAPTDPERARRLLDRLHLAELTPAQQQRLDAIALEYFHPTTTDQRRGELWREQRGLTVTHEEPDHYQIAREYPVALSEEPPAAGSPQRRQITPPSAPTVASEEQIDSMLIALGHSRAHAIQADREHRHEQQTADLAEAAGERPFTDSELGLAAGLRARYGLAELTPRERAACEEADRRRADEDYRADLAEARRVADENAALLAEITAKVAPQVKRQQRAAGVVLRKSK